MRFYSLSANCTICLLCNVVFKTLYTLTCFNVHVLKFVSIFCSAKNAIFKPINLDFRIEIIVTGYYTSFTLSWSINKGNITETSAQHVLHAVFENSKENSICSKKTQGS